MKRLLLKYGAGITITMLLFAYSFTLALAQDIEISGTVTNAETGQAMPAVNILVLNTNIGTATDVNGHYTLNVPSLQGSLKFSFIGYKPITVNINGRTTVDVSLEAATIGLEDLVVTALGVEREKKSVSYSVDQVDGGALTDVPLTNPINSLSGRVAGVIITPNTGGPGSPSRVVIRGNTSLTGYNQPLYVVDGVPIDNSNFGTFNNAGEYSHGNYGGGVGILNPENIKSITVLKGPNAAALYGSRASNGVIMITTKRGYARKGLGVSYSGSFTWKQPMVLPEFQNKYGQGSNGQTYTDVINLNETASSWGAPFDGSSQLYYTGEMRPYVAQPNNVKDFFRNAGTFNNTLAFAGGGENSTFRFAYTRTQANSMLPNSGLESNNFILRATSSLTDKLFVDGKITYGTQNSDHRPFQGTEGIMATLLDMPRNVSLSDLRDYQNPDYSVRTYGPSTSGNPYWILFHDINQDSKRRFLGFMKASYDFTRNLSAMVRIGTDYSRQHTERVNKYGHWYYGSGRFTLSNYSTTETNADFLLTYQKAFTDKFNVDVKLGGNHRVSTFRYMSIYGENFKVPTLWSLGNAGTLNPSATPLSKKVVNSLYATATLSYNEIFFLNLTGRNDWSSALAPGNWSYFYPSIGASVLINEFIDPEHNIIDLWKVRASWAQVGNDTSPYQLTNSYNLSKNGYLGLTVMTIPSLLLSNDLKPEKITSIEFGTNIELLNNRLYASFTYYDIQSENLIMDVPLTSGTGYSNFRTNVGLMKNKGIEVQFGGLPVQTLDFTWDVSLNFAKNQNELVELYTGLDNFVFTTSNDGVISVRATVGGGFGEIWGTTYRRSPEGKLLLDATGRPQAAPELVKLGNYQPDFTGGITNTFQYKNFSLRVLIDATIGGQVYVATQRFLDAAGVSKKTLQYRGDDGIVVDGVIKVNNGTADDPIFEYVQNTQALNAGQYWGAYSSIASNYVMDKTNIRLREASLSFTLPPTLLSKTPVKSASISVVGRNLFFLYTAIDGFDPSTSYSSNQYGQGVMYFNLPTARQFGFNINLNF